jgi:hypothetical protein
MQSTAGATRWLSDSLRGWRLMIGDLAEVFSLRSHIVCVL